MKILDLYIIKKFLSTFIFVVFIFITIIVVIDIIEKMEDLRKMKATAWEAFTQYYLNFIPYIANMISPIMVFITTIFVTAQMSERTEIVAILSSGISFLRFMVPYMISSTIIAIFTFFLINWTIPMANKQRLDFELKHMKNAFRFSQQDVHIQVAPKTVAYIQSYENMTNIGYQFGIDIIEKNRLVQKLDAERILWDSLKRKWRIENYTVRTIDGLKETLKKGKSLDTALNLHPGDFQSKYMFNERLTLPELDTYITLLRSRGADNTASYVVEKYSRFTYPFAVIILTAIGVILSSRKNRRGVGAQIATGFVIAFVYVLLYYLMVKGVAPNGSMPMLLAVCIPNIAFTLLAMILYKTVPK